MDSSEIRYDGRVAVVTGAGNGLGREYALYYAKRGASVVVNDYGVTLLGDVGSSTAADAVVAEITKNGGKAVANYDSVVEGEKIIQTAMKAFGRVDILVNNAGILRDRTFAKMTDKEWEIVVDVHLHGAFRCTKAAWPIFRNQKYGRIIMTASPAGVYGNFGQSNYSAAKHALIGFSNTLSAEGAKYNITCNTISPLAASRLTETSMTKDLLKYLDPKSVVPVVGFLTHEQTKISGDLIELAGGFVSNARWEVSNGAVFKPDSNFTPASIAAKYGEITSFANPMYPTIRKGVDYLGLMKKASSQSPNPKLSDLRYDGKVVIVTGSGAGLGRIYALAFAKYGAKVVVNDVGRVNGVMSADLVVSEIKKDGGQAVANYDSVENGENVVKTAIDNYGRVDIIINNAGILRDKSFIKMTLKEWYDVYNIHLRGTYKVTKAAWPYFLKQKSGTVINTSSSVGIYGNFGQANYSSCKSAMIGFTKTLAQEGAKHGIRVNCIAPNAGTAMTATIMPQEIVELLKPDYVFPLIGFLCHDSCKDTGKLFQVGSCWAGEVRRQSTQGYVFGPNETYSPESVRGKWNIISDYSIGKVRNSNMSRDFTMYVVQRLMESNPSMKIGEVNKRQAELAASSAKVSKIDVAAARNHKFETKPFSYTQRDVMLYALGIGATRKDLNWVYELSPNFRTFPTFAVLPKFFVGPSVTEFLPKFNPMMLLHGEEFVQIHSPIPTSGTLYVSSEVVDIADKGSGAAVVTRTILKDSNQKPVSEIESTTFIRGLGGFSKLPGFKPVPPAARSPVATFSAPTPKTLPDVTIQQNISPSQAAIYRLSGDYNPLHIDPKMAAMGKFSQPILHGLCSMGFAARHVVQCMAGGDSNNLSAIKVRFSSPVYPGETIQTSMWVSKQDPTVVQFESKVVERNVVVISSALAKLKVPARISIGMPQKL
ncbi:hypothetical protein BB560_002896 [Smittium megazygosporum]|uniref:Ketoreductase domain-containing protein n=1 Tax=Smittium megazygosporum TaxID=133381 RepID=A0A2T9ZDI4_9FUNG|nr:hypothetical protein BB560_002896 [Smittium megazygosporum]